MMCYSQIGALDDLSKTIMVLVVCLYMYIRGKRINLGKARHWLDESFPVLKQQFYGMGVPCKPAENFRESRIQKHSIIQKCSPSKFLIYASGRKYCTGALFSLELSPRQDIFSPVYHIFNMTNDRLVVDIPMEDMEPVVFTLVRRTEYPFVAHAFRDVSLLARQVPLEMLPHTLWCMTDYNELLTTFLGPQVNTFISQYEHLIDVIHISDLNRVSGIRTVPHKSIHMQFRLGNTKEERYACLNLVFHYIDLVGGLKLSSSAKIAANKAREGFFKTQPRSETMAASQSTSSLPE